MRGVKAGSQHLFAVATQDTSYTKPAADQDHCMDRMLRTSAERMLLAKKLLPWHLLLGT